MGKEKEEGYIPSEYKKIPDKMNLLSSIAIIITPAIIQYHQMYQSGYFVAWLQD